MNKMYLYVIVNRVNGKKYVGITNNLRQRRTEHYSGNGSKILWQAIDKYGSVNLVMIARYAGDETWIKRMEQVLIRVLNTRAPNGYNLTDGGEGTLGCKPSSETRRKMSQSHKGKTMWPRSLETRRKIAQSKRGKVAPPDHIFRLGVFKGAQHANAIALQIDGVTYGTIAEAADAVGLNKNTLYSRVRKYVSTDSWPSGWSLAS